MENEEIEDGEEPEAEPVVDLDLPPDNAEDWDDDQWLDWLKRTDPDPNEVTSSGPVPKTVGSRIAHSTGGQIMGQAMLGLSNAIYGQTDDDIVIVIPADSNPDEDELLKVNLHPDDPRQSTVKVRDVGEKETDT